MRLTSKSQVTIPKHIRENLRLQPGDEVDFVFDGEKVVLKRAGAPRKAPSADAFIKQLEAMGQKLDRMPMTTDELMSLTRGPFNDIDAH